MNFSLLKITPKDAFWHIFWHKILCSNLRIENWRSLRQKDDNAKMSFTRLAPKSFIVCIICSATGVVENRI